MNGYDPAMNGVRWKFPFFIIWIPENISLITSGMVQFSLVWFVTIHSSSALAVSAAVSMVLIPRGFCNPLIGTLVDRFSRKKIMILSRVMTAGTSCLMSLLFFYNTLTVTAIIFIIFVRALADTFHNKAILSTTSLMVPLRFMTSVSAINQVVLGMTMFLSPGVGALLLKWSSFELVMGLDVIMALCAVIPLLSVSVPGRSLLEKTSSGLITECCRGFRYIYAWSGALGMLAVSMVMNFTMQPFFGLISVLVKRMHYSELEFGMLGAVVGAGFLIGGAVLSIWQGFARRMLTVLIAVLLAGCVLLTAGITIHWGFPWIVSSFFFAGFLMPFCMGPIQSLIQVQVPNDMQGRVFSILEGVSTLTAPVAMVLAGIVFDICAPKWWYLWGGVVAILISIYGFFSSKIRNLGHIS